MNIFDQILDLKRQEVDQIQDIEFGDLVGQIRSLKEALSSPGISIIAEIKMKSPITGIHDAKNIAPHPNLSSNLLPFFLCLP